MQLSQYWDPVGTVLLEPDFEADRKKSEKKVVFYQRNPWLIKLFVAAAIAFPVVMFLILRTIQFASVQSEVAGSQIVLLGLSLLPLLVVFPFLSDYKKNLFAFLISKEYGFLYYQRMDLVSPKKYQQKYVHTFGNGWSPLNEFFKNQFWGTLPNDTTSFWSATYTYRTFKSVISKYLSQSNQVIICKMPQPTESLGYLTVNNSGLAVTTTFQDIFSTESATLSDEVKTQLVNLVNISKSLRAVEIVADSIVFSFDSYFLKLPNTNMLVKTEIDSRDKDIYLKTLAQISTVVKALSPVTQ